jgi:hypothetical protein
MRNYPQVSTIDLRFIFAQDSYGRIQCISKKRRNTAVRLVGGWAIRRMNQT